MKLGVSVEFSVFYEQFVKKSLNSEIKYKKIILRVPRLQKTPALNSMVMVYNDPNYLPNWNHVRYTVSKLLFFLNFNKNFGGNLSGMNFFVLNQLIFNSSTCG